MGNTTVCEETVENRFRFNGQQYDAITQKYYLRARFYNPVIARFTQEDTYRGDGLNLYAYCENNPVYYEDQSGYVADCIKEAYKKYRNQGMTPQEALDAANRDRFYQENLKKGMSAEDAAKRAQVDSEVHKAMQKYQMLVNTMDIDPKTQDRRPWVHGTKVHTAVRDAMNAWVDQQGFKTIDVNTETQTSHIKNGIRTLKINTLAHKIFSCR